MPGWDQDCLMYLWPLLQMYENRLLKDLSMYGGLNMQKSRRYPSDIQMFLIQWT